MKVRRIRYIYILSTSSDGTPQNCVTIERTEYDIEQEKICQHERQCQVQQCPRKGLFGTGIRIWQNERLRDGVKQGEGAKGRDRLFENVQRTDSVRDTISRSNLLLRRERTSSYGGTPAHTRASG